MDCFVRATCTVHLISAQNSHEGIKCTKAKAGLTVSARRSDFFFGPSVINRLFSFDTTKTGEKIHKRSLSKSRTHVRNVLLGTELCTTKY